MAVAVTLSLAACGGGGGGGTTSFMLTVQKAGTGTGAVTGGGISCGGTCSASLASGTAVTLTATADAGTTFASWTGCDSTAGATCDVMVTADRTVTATFDPIVNPPQYTLTVLKAGTGTGAVTGGGIACGATCSASLASGTAVTLTATADAGTTFASWTGCDSTAGAICDVMVTADRTVTATFDPIITPPQYTLTVLKAGTGTGTVTGGGISCGAACSAVLVSGTAVTLTATADAGSTFASWTGCDSSAGATCDVTVTADRTVTATFDPIITPPQYTLAVVKGGTGTGTVTGGGIACGATCSASYVSGTAVTLTATADAGATFASWTGCDSTAGATCSVTVTADRTVTAIFDPIVNPPRYTLTVLKAGTGTGAVTGGGISCGATCSASLASGTAVTLTATADAGSTFAGWTGCDGTAGATCSVTVTADRTVTATFDPVQYTLNVQKGGTGTGAVTGGGISCGATCSASLASGTAVTLTATADAGSTFAGWTGCDSTVGAACGVTMTASRTVTATFAPVQYTLSVQKGGTGTGTVTGGGISCGATCSASYVSGTAVTLTASADAGSTFGSWTGCDSTVGAACGVTMTASRTVTATFAPATGSLLLVNGTAFTVAELRLSPAGAGTWGPNLLTSQIPPAGTFTLAGVAAGSYDLRAVASDGTTTWQASAVAITAGGQSTWTLTPPTPTFGSLGVTNGTTLTISELYASPAAAGTWGPNLLTAQIAPGGAFTLADVPVGTYDFRAIASDGITYWQASAVAIVAGALHPWTLLPPDLGSLAVMNNHCIAVDQLYLKPASSPNWSANQLVAPVDPGTTFTFTGMPVGTYDVSAVALDGESWITSGLAVAAGGTFTWSTYMPAGTGCLTVVNNTADTIDFLFDPPSPSGCGANSWGTERLMGTPILPNTSFTLSRVPQGPHDLRVMGRTPIGDPVDTRLCGMGVPAGGTFTWYLTLP
jgi:uncharacterized repeat protein (TIGR02543 family)